MLVSEMQVKTQESYQMQEKHENMCLYYTMLWVICELNGVFFAFWNV